MKENKPCSPFGLARVFVLTRFARSKNTLCFLCAGANIVLNVYAELVVAAWGHVDGYGDNWLFFHLWYAYTVLYWFPGGSS